MKEKLVTIVGLFLILGLLAGCGKVEEEKGTTPTETDTTPPTVVSVTPPNGATAEAVVGASVTTISATFSESMESSTINTSTFILSSSLGSITGTVTYDAASKKATFAPASPLPNNVTCAATITASAKDSAGNPLATAETWSFSTIAASATLLYQKDGAAAGDLFGVSVSGAGDIDGDGKADFIVGASAADPSGKTDAGSAYVYSGADGSLLYQKDGEAAEDRFGQSVAVAGDVNGDGKADFIVGAYGANPSGMTTAGSVYVYSGADGSLLYQKNGEAADISFGYSVSGTGDINGDGKADFIVGACRTDPSSLTDAGSAYVYSGADGSLLYQKDGGAAGDAFGYSVATAGDVNGDGNSDFMVGAYNADPASKSSAGSAYVYSGADGSLLYQKDGDAAGDWFGVRVSTAGDVNGDGKSDFMVGATHAAPSSNTEAGSAYVYSGADGVLLYQKDGTAAEDWFGGRVSTAGDVNGDGKSDFMVGALGADPSGLSGAGSVYVYSGADGSLLYQKDGEAAGDRFGRGSAAGDVNGDGKVDFIIGAYFADPSGLSNAGSAYIYISQ